MHRTYSWTYTSSVFSFGLGHLLVCSERFYFCLLHRWDKEKNSLLVHFRQCQWCVFQRLPCCFISFQLHGRRAKKKKTKISRFVSNITRIIMRSSSSRFFFVLISKINISTRRVKKKSAMNGSMHSTRHLLLFRFIGWQPICAPQTNWWKNCR